jgi:flagellum-specific ATP synthase
VNEPISDTVRGIIDGHIILSRTIAARNHYPAIDVLGSVSRLMNDIVSQEQVDTAGAMRNLLAVHEANYDLVSIGAYKSGTNPVLDEAIRKLGGINAFLRQKVEEKVSYEDSVALMKKAIG